MIIIETGKFKSFQEYFHSLAKTARKNYKYAKDHNHIQYNKVPFDKKEIQNWMDLWGRQLIRGEHRQYAFTADALEGKNILCFRALEKNEVIAYQFVEVIDGYMNCHPVMYEKEKYADRYLSKWMWFKLIEWAIFHKVDIVDLGGGNDDSWREMIKTRDKYPNPAYKWMYVPEEVKNNPDKQQNYKVEHNGISKRIYKID